MMPNALFFEGLPTFEPKKNDNEKHLEMSPGPLGTMIFETTYIRIMGK